LSNVTVDFDVNAAIELRAPALRKAQVKLDVEVIKYSNYFCPQDEGTLQKSALTASRIGEGIVEWNTPYAAAQYYGLPRKSKDMNPNARMKWFESAKVVNLEKWQRIAQEGLND
jgi:hypothetical protein